MPKFGEAAAFAPAPCEKDLTEPSSPKMPGKQFHALAAAELAQQHAAAHAPPPADGGFHAKPLPASTFGDGFEPAKPARAPLAPARVNLASDARAPARKAYDAQSKQRRADDAHAKKAAAARADEAERREVASLRRKSIEDGGFMFKARPMPRASLGGLGGAPRAAEQ